MKRIFLALLIPILLITGCAKAPVTGRTQIIMLSPRQEMALGFQAEEEIFKTEKVSDNPRFVKPVQRVGYRIAKATGLDLDWKFHVIENEKVPNAFCLANGHVFVYTGLFKYIDNDAQLATVMAHEIGHAIAHHVAEKVSVGLLTNVATALATAAINSNVDSNEERLLYNAALGIGSQVGVILPYSRMQESEADHIGLILMAEACYDPREALKFWERFAKADGGEEPIVYLSTHPATSQRIEHLKALMPRAMELYKACRQTPNGPAEKKKPSPVPETLGQPVN
jgi:predicted Zn-dependent protease